MNGPEILHLIRRDLKQAVARQPRPPTPRPMDASPWLAMSVMQKAIRRGREDLALGAAATLLRDAPDKLWRRIGCIAYEDVGVASLEAVGLATAALAGKQASRRAWRRMGGRQLRCLRTQPSTEVPGSRRSCDGLRASPRLRQSPRRAAAPDNPRLDRGRDRARVCSKSGLWRSGTPSERIDAGRPLRVGADNPDLCLTTCAKPGGRTPSSRSRARGSCAPAKCCARLSRFCPVSGAKPPASRTTNSRLRS